MTSAIASSADVSSRIGLNTNLTVADKEYHVQTEDLGLQRTCIVTHVFAKNGQVVLKLRFDYSKYVGHPNLVSIIPRAMQAQHLSVMQKLRKEGEPSVDVSCTDLPCVPDKTPSPDVPVSEPAKRRPRLQPGVWDRLVEQARAERVRTQMPAIPLPEPTPGPHPKVVDPSTSADRWTAAARTARREFENTPPPDLVEAPQSLVRVQRNSVVDPLARRSYEEAMTFLHEGHVEEALVSLCRAVEREPKNTAYRTHLLRVLSRLGND